MSEKRKCPNCGFRIRGKHHAEGDHCQNRKHPRSQQRIAKLAKDRDAKKTEAA